MDLKYTRQGKIMIEFATGKKTVYESINKAKKASHEIQKANGGLGMGSVSVLKNVENNGVPLQVG